MFVDFASMARELGTRPDALRIAFGIPTRLQRLIRAATTFEEVAALAGEFRQDDYHRSCGPKFEEVEKEEYLARRAELFPAYLARFTTIESFQSFGINAVGDAFTYECEEAEGSKKLCELFGVKIDEGTEARNGDELERLVEIHAEASKFVRGERSERPRVSAREILGFLTMRIRGVLEMELEAAKVERDTARAVAAFEKLKGISAYDLRRDREKENRYPWHWLWTETTSLENILFIEKEIPGFVDRSAVEGRIAEAIGAAIEKTADFSEALAFAKRFAGRDDDQPSEVYSFALVSVAEKAKTVPQLRQLIQVWRGRHLRGKTSFPQPELPRVFLNKWDAFFLVKARAEPNLRKLAKLAERSPWGSEARRTAERRLEAHFEALMAAAPSEEEIDRIEGEAKALSRGINLLSYSFKRDLESRRHAEKVQALWEKLERGEEVENEKQVLVGLYHEFKEEDPERAHKVLLRLAQHFPAEVVDEVPTEV